jgi:hypothetical protein
MSAEPQWVSFVNTTTEEIPGGAVLEPAGGTDARGRLRVRKCTRDNSLSVMFNSPATVATASGPEEDKPGGVCRPAWPAIAAAIKPEEVSAYATDTQAGTVSGSWYLSTEGYGFRWVGAEIGGIAFAIPEVMSVGGSGSGGTTITTANTTGSPSGSTSSETTTTLSANTTSGLQIQGDAPTRQISALAASTTQQGMVTTGHQDWLGPKTSNSRFSVAEPETGRISGVGIDPDTASIHSIWTKKETSSNVDLARLAVSAASSQLTLSSTSPVADNYGTASLACGFSTSPAARLSLLNLSLHNGTVSYSAILSLETSVDYLICSANDFLLRNSEGDTRYGVRRGSTDYWGIDDTAALSGTTLEVPIVKGGIVTGWGTVTLPAAGEPGPPGEPGTNGTNGTNGTDGADGADGKTVRNGSGAPAGSLGVDGDFYIDTTADAIYGPKTAGAWGSATSLVGPAGPMGETGPEGPTGPAATVDGGAGTDLTGFIKGDGTELSAVVSVAHSDIAAMPTLTLLGNDSGSTASPRALTASEALTLLDISTGSGTVTSVDVTSASSAIVVSGSPITTSGTITLTSAERLQQIVDLAPPTNGGLIGLNDDGYSTLVSLGDGFSYSGGTLTYIPHIVNEVTTTDITNDVDGIVKILVSYNGVITGDVNAASYVTNLPISNLANLAGLSVLGRSANSSGGMAAITAGTDNQVLRRLGTGLGFGTVALAGLTNLAGVSVLGRSANSTGVMAAITATENRTFLCLSGSALSFQYPILHHQETTQGSAFTLAAVDAWQSVTGLSMTMSLAGKFLFIVRCRAFTQMSSGTSLVILRVLVDGVEATTSGVLVSRTLVRSETATGTSSAACVFFATANFAQVVQAQILADTTGPGTYATFPVVGSNDFGRNSITAVRVDS